MSLSVVLAVLVSVTLSSVQAQNNGDIRLVNTANQLPSEGRLEIFMNSKWGTFCSKNSDLNAVANTACRQLRYTNAFSFGRVADMGYPVASDSTPIHFGSINCSSAVNGVCSKDYSMHVLRCSVDMTVDQSICNHNEDIGISCNIESIVDNPYKGQVALYPTAKDLPANVSVSSGALGIFFYKSPQPGLVCGTGLNQLVADSACRQIGYTNARSFNSTATSTKTYAFWDAGLSCPSQSHSCLNGCFSKTPNNQTTCNTVVILSCEFQLSLKSKETAGYPLQCDKTLENTCNPQPIIHESTVGIIVAVVIIVAIVAAIAACITVAVCCLVPGCVCYRRRQGYHTISGS